MDMIDDGEAGNAHEFTVGELSGALKRMIEGEFGRVRVKGEVGRVMHARSGHLYFDIKDDRAVLACTTWKGQVSGLSVVPEEGMEIVATGRMTTFGSQSKYQLNAEEVTVAGIGALMAMLEKTKARLSAEGLFAPERKQALPPLPDVIGVITSPTGAVIRDILHRLRERFPRKVLVWPVAVQGKGSAEQVAAAIRGFNAMTPGGGLPRPDLLIVARGGGSIEDLWSFNEEIVVRAVADSTIPLISAVGHETDTTLIDFASDRRAPTPTAAAELAVPVRTELLGAVEDRGGRLIRALGAGIEARRQRLRDLSRALPRQEILLEGPRQRLDLLDGRLGAALLASAGRERQRLARAEGAIRPGALARRLAEDRRRLNERAAGLQRGPDRAIAQGRERLLREARRLVPTALRLRFEKEAERFATARARLSRAAVSAQASRREALTRLDRMRESLGYRETLARGFAVVRGSDGVITSKAAASSERALEIEFSDGRLAVGAPAAPKTRKSPPPPPEQGKLL